MGNKQRKKRFNRPTLAAHCLVCNEERWVWYAIQSVLDYVDEVMVFDTGSSDRTADIVRSLSNPKIKFEEKGKVDADRFVVLRQEMLERTNSDWILILDGDDVWTRSAVQELKKAIGKAGKEKKAVVVGQWMCQGDVFHYSAEAEELQHPQAPRGIRGFMSIRAIRSNLPGLKAVGKYGIEGYEDEDQSFKKKEALTFLKNKYFHMSFLPRSSTREKDREVMLRRFKTRFTQGIAFPEGTEYPEVFYLERPEFVATPWKGFSWLDQACGIYYRVQNFVERLIPRK